MAFTKTWSIGTLGRDPSDGFVREVHYFLIGKEDDTEIAERGGTLKFIKPSSLPSDFIDYDKLDEATVLSWVKNSLGSEVVSGLEETVTTKIEMGKPF
tara:strand:+ start:394 stop:687 length:294 start_codon:yes stop_codon:yes gene_type:complete